MLEIVLYYMIHMYSYDIILLMYHGIILSATWTGKSRDKWELWNYIPPI